MQLSPGERSILSYFGSSVEAQKAAEELKRAGYNTVSVDRISRYGVELDADYNNPLNRATTLTGLALYSTGIGDNLTDSERILLAADPSVSGVGNYSYGAAGGHSYILTLVTDEEKVEPAVEIIKRHGGTV